MNQNFLRASLSLLLLLAATWATIPAIAHSPPADRTVSISYTPLLQHSWTASPGITCIPLPNGPPPGLQLECYGPDWTNHDCWDLSVSGTVTAGPATLAATTQCSPQHTPEVGCTAVSAGPPANCNAADPLNHGGLAPFTCSASIVQVTASYTVVCHVHVL